jgi:hypothetical protein
MDLAALFPSGAHRFHLTLRRVAPGDFFGPQDTSGALLRERVRWIEADAARYASGRSDAARVVDEFLELAAGWGPGCDAAARSVAATSGAAARLAAIGGAFEPDILLLRRGADGEFRLAAGALCFPTGWALEEKLGLTLDEIHGVVPGLNAALAGTIRQFLDRLPPGSAYLRDNWGISAHADLNQHPFRGLSGPQAPVDLGRLWLRVEHQALVALPRAGGVLFGIRIANHRLDRLTGETAVLLREGLREMPEELAAYKRLTGVRAELIRRLT